MLRTDVGRIICAGLTEPLRNRCKLALVFVTWTGRGDIRKYSFSALSVIRPSPSLDAEVKQLPVNTTNLPFYRRLCRPLLSDLEIEFSAALADNTEIYSVYHVRRLATLPSVFHLRKVLILDWTQPHTRCTAVRSASVRPPCPWNWHFAYTKHAATRTPR